MFTDCSIKTQQDGCSFRVLTDHVLRQKLDHGIQELYILQKFSFKI